MKFKVLDSVKIPNLTWLYCELYSVCINTVGYVSIVRGFRRSVYCEVKLSK